jgi:hypothetical protein
LYNCGGRISNLGDALSGALEETDSTYDAATGKYKTKVNKNHTIQAPEIYEQVLPDGYQ